MTELRVVTGARVEEHIEQSSAETNCAYISFPMFWMYI